MLCRRQILIGRFNSDTVYRASRYSARHVCPRFSSRRMQSSENAGKHMKLTFFRRTCWSQEHMYGLLLQTARYTNYRNDGISIVNCAIYVDHINFDVLVGPCFYTVSAYFCRIVLRISERITVASRRCVHRK